MSDNIFFNNLNSTEKENITETELHTWEEPTDVSEQIKSWLPKCLQLANSFSSPEIISELQAIHHRLNLPSFLVAFVGEFSRGKSTLLNRLLEQDLLPVRAVPTTATLTSITAGEQEGMEVIFEDNHQEVRKLEASSWDDLLATNSTGEEKEVLAKVQLTVANSWLKSLETELIDTPGVGDLSSTRAALAFDILSQSDGAVLVVSATHPLSMTEAAFLEEEVIGRHIPRILVVVSKLNSIPEKEQAEVMAVTKERIAKISADIPVLPSYPINKNISESAALEAVRSQIATMISQGDRQAWRSQQVANQLIDALSDLIDAGNAAIAAAKISAKEREEALQKQKTDMRDAELKWEGLRLDVDKRRMQREQTLRKQILNGKQEFIEELLFELSKTSNPKSWWEKDLPFKMRRKLTFIGRKYEDFVLKSLAQDFQWLESEVSRRFSTKITQQKSNAPQNQEINANLQEIEMSSVQRYRLLSRIGTGAAMLGAYVLGGAIIPGIGVIVSFGGGLLSEVFLNSKLEEQRKLIQDKLERTVDGVFDKYCNEVAERLRQLYDQLIKETKRQQNIWYSAKTAAMENSNSKSDENSWQQLIDEASTLKEEILTKVKS